MISCHHYGTQGDTQFGIDAVATLRNGSKTAYQFKQYKKFTVADAKKAIIAASYTADRYVAMLSCEATRKVRDEFAKAANWNVWDVRESRSKYALCALKLPAN